MSKGCALWAVLGGCPREQNQGLGRVKQARRESQYKAGFLSWDSVPLALLGNFVESPLDLSF